MNDVIIVGAGSVYLSPRDIVPIIPKDCPLFVTKLDEIAHCKHDLEFARIDRIEIPTMPEPCSGSISGYLSQGVFDQLRMLSESLAISMAELVDAVRNFREQIFRSSIDIDSLTLALGKINIERDYEAFQSKTICTKPFKSKIKKSQYAASTYQRSGFQATRKLARGRI